MGALTVLITGASGRLGQVCVAEALARGYNVRALSRSGVSPAGGEIVQADLSCDPLKPALDGVDAILHLAAGMTGNAEDIERDTGLATMRLLSAAKLSGTPKIVLAGSIGVYGIASVEEGHVVNEHSPVETEPEGRDSYTRSKIAQELMIRESGLPFQILRIGAIWGPGQLWNAHLGIAKGPLLVRVGNEGQIPLAHITRAAEAMVAAITYDGPDRVFNITDDDLPDRIRYLKALYASGWPKMIVPISWRLLDRIAAPTGRRGLLNRPTLHARMKPVAWSNKRSLSALNLSSQPGFDALMSDALAQEVRA